MANEDAARLQQLEAELVARIGAFPRISPLLPRLLAEFKEYHTIANTAVMTASNNTAEPSLPKVLWNSLQLPAWFEAARIVALVFVSSASVEMIFSLYDSLFGTGEFQSAGFGRASEDRREAAICEVAPF